MHSPLKHNEPLEAKLRREPEVEVGPDRVPQTGKLLTDFREGPKDNSRNSKW